MSRLLCFGMGYTARALARRLDPEGWEVVGTSRDGQAGTIRFDRGHPLPPAAFDRVTHILASIPPDEDGDPALDLLSRQISPLTDRRRSADAPTLPSRACGGGSTGVPSPASGGGSGWGSSDGSEREYSQLRWLGYLSTTGVYGDRGGGWVDETSELRPSGARGQRRVAAERGWLDLWRSHGVPVHIFRLAAIYGPGRSPFGALRAGTAKRIDKPGQVFSRVHVEDIVNVLRASIAQPRPGAAYNVCDDQPAEPAEVIAYAASLLGVAAPPLVPFEAADLSPMARSFWDDNKRVANQLIKRELAVRLRYPDYRAGMTAILAAGDCATFSPERSGGRICRSR